MALCGSRPDVLQRQAADLVAQGHRAVKIRPHAERDARVEQVVARVRAIREAIGYDIDLMYDVNQTWTPSRAIRVGRALEEFELFWLEDPTAMHDIEGWFALISVLLICIDAVIKFVINPSVWEQVDLPSWEAIIAAVVAFYFGER